jgi:hypothetical protein
LGALIEKYTGPFPDTFQLQYNNLIDVQVKKEMCKAGMEWLRRSTLYHTNSSESAEGNLGLYMVYTMGKAAQSWLVPNEAERIFISAGCVLTDPDPDRYLKRAAELGSLDAATGLMQMYKAAGDLDRARYWGQRALERALADQSAGIPQECLNDPASACFQDRFGNASLPREQPLLNSQTTQTAPPTVPPSPKVRPYSFEDFRVQGVYRGPPTMPDFRGRDRAHAMFRTRIRNGIKAGANFAGHYAVIPIGCGTDCVFYPVADVTTGQVYDFPYGGEEYYALDLKFETHSTLIIARWVNIKKNVAFRNNLIGRMDVSRL